MKDRIHIAMADVDGTLLTSEQKVDPETVEAIRELRKQGTLFGLCTGREVKSVLDLLETWGIDGLVDAVIGNGGGTVLDLSLNREEEQYPLDGELIQGIIKHYQDMDVNFVIPKNGLLYAPKDDELIRELSEADRVPYEIVDFDEFLKKPRSKVMLTFKPEMMDAVKERSKTFSDPSFSGAPLVTASVLFEYMDPRVTKSNGLKKLLSWHGWTPENLCTFGDEDNDYDMTCLAGVGVVMANGSEKTRSAADYITDDNNHAGIAHFIQKHLLKSE